MPIRKEKSVEIYGTTYKIKQLAASKGAITLVRILRLFFSGAGSLGEILQRPEVQELMSGMFANQFVISEAVLSQLPAEISVKLTNIKDQVYQNVGAVREALQPLLSPEEFEHCYMFVCQKAAQPKDEAASMISVSSYALQLLYDIIDKIDEEKFERLLSDLINNSVIRYHVTGTEEHRKWLTESGIPVFDEHFAGRYNEMIELFVYLIIFNYAESLIMLKKNQILTHLRPILDKIMPEKPVQTNE